MERISFTSMMKPLQCTGCTHSDLSSTQRVTATSPVIWRAPDSNWEVELDGLIIENRGDLSNVAYLVIDPDIDVEAPSGFEKMASGTAPFLNGGGDWKVYRAV